MYGAKQGNEIISNMLKYGSRTILVNNENQKGEDKRSRDNNPDEINDEEKNSTPPPTTTRTLKLTTTTTTSTIAIIESENSFIQSFPDVLISNLCQTYITEQTSAIRASTFMVEFVLPSLYQLHNMHSTPTSRYKTTTASRVLIATLSFLARDRPTEFVSSLLIPCLCSSPSHTTTKNHKNDESPTTSPYYIPSKAQCELVNKIIKQVSMTKDILSSIVHELTCHMIWTEQTVPIITTCLQKKIQLNDNTIDLISEKICQCLMGSEEGEKDNKKSNHDCQSYGQNNQFLLRKGIKLSTLFHTFVMKHGIQILNCSCKDKLLDAATALKTMLGKSIRMSLKKLK